MAVYSPSVILYTNMKNCVWSKSYVLRFNTMIWSVYSMIPIHMKKSFYGLDTLAVIISKKFEVIPMWEFFGGWDACQCWFVVEWFILYNNSGKGKPAALNRQWKWRGDRRTLFWCWLFTRENLLEEFISCGFSYWNEYQAIVPEHENNF